MFRRDLFHLLSRILFGVHVCRPMCAFKVILQSGDGCSSFGPEAAEQGLSSLFRFLSTLSWSLSGWQTPYAYGRLYSTLALLLPLPNLSRVSRLLQSLLKVFMSFGENLRHLESFAPVKTSVWVQQMWCGTYSRATASRSSSWTPLGHPVVPTVMGDAGDPTAEACFWLPVWWTVRGGSYSISWQCTSSEFARVIFSTAPRTKQPAKLGSALAGQNPFAHK